MLETFKSRFVLNFITDDRWKYILDGLGVTLKVTLFAGIVGILIGFLIAPELIPNARIATSDLSILTEPNTTK